MAKKIKQNKEKKEIPKKEQKKAKKEINQKSKEKEKEIPKEETIKDIEQEDEQNEVKEKELNKEELNKKYELKLEQVTKELIPKISSSQIEKALKALISYKNKLNSSSAINVLSGDFDDYIYATFGFYKYPLRYSLSPSKIDLPTGIYDLKYNSNICLIVKNPKSDFKDLNIEFPFNIKIIDIEKLKTKYQQYSKKRELMKKYDLFLCDNRIKFVLRKLLGKCFYASKKIPYSISLNYEDKEKIKNDIIEIVNKSTIFHMNNGPIYNIKFGRFSMNLEENKENLKECIKQIVPHILKYDIDLDELRNISIKGNNTLELPLYEHIKEEDLKIFTGNY
jgi:ribosome biogenesis protein UTP30